MGIFGILMLAAASFTNAILPGPCILLTVSRASSCGLRSALMVSWGVVLANLALVSVAVLTMVGLLFVSQEALGMLRWLGLAVLLLLGLKLLSSKPAPESSEMQRSTPWRDAGAGFLVGVSSPYNLVFMLALLPQFVPASGISSEVGFVMAAAVLGGALLAQLCASGAGLAAAKLLALTTSRGLFDRVGGLTMVGFAGLFAISPV